MINNDVELINNMCNHQCSRCGNCCGIFIPVTEHELSVIKKYVKEHNIQPIDDRFTDGVNFEGRCCFYDTKLKKCNIYPARPYVCRDFRCDRKDWKKYRDKYDKHGKYNCISKKKFKLITFDDAVYNNYGPLILFLLAMCKATCNGELDAKVVYETFKRFNRLDALDYFKAYSESDVAVDLRELFK